MEKGKTLPSDAEVDAQLASMEAQFDPTQLMALGDISMTSLGDVAVTRLEGMVDDPTISGCCSSPTAVACSAIHCD